VSTRFRILVGVVVAALALLVGFALINALVAAHQTRDAEADVGRILRLPGADLQVTDSGPRDAPALVLLHGWAESLHIWDPDLAKLPARLRIVRVDLPGCGGSEAPTSGYSIGDQARQVARALQRLGVNDAVVAGHSMGADIAVQLAVDRPDLVSRLTLIDPPAAPGYSTPSLLVRSSVWPIVGPLAHNFSPTALKRRGLEIAVARGSPVPEQMVEDLERVTWPAYEQGYDETQSWVEREPVPDRLIASGRPALVIWGAEDQLVSPDAARLFDPLPRTRVVRLPGIGHTAPLEAPTRTARLIGSFAVSR
jgi:pimeloyl-ACP methyl ester carboxylesterase